MTSRGPLLSRMFGRGRPAEAEVTAAVAAAAAAVPGVVAHDVAYNHLQYSSGALSGLVDVTGPEIFDQVLSAVYAALADRLGTDADRVVVYLVGRAPDGATISPDTLALPERPTGRDLARRYR